MGKSNKNPIKLRNCEENARDSVPFNITINT